jgi:hypothetical protein
MVRNGWIHPLLCASHPTKNRALSPYYLFRDEALFKVKYLYVVSISNTQGGRYDEESNRYFDCCYAGSIWFYHV